MSNEKPCEGCKNAESCGIKYDAEIQGMYVSYCIKRKEN